MNPRLKIQSFLRDDTVVGALLALTVFCVYLATLGPSIGFIDAGELAAVAYTFGIAHPTGYPLFTLLAGVFSHLPLFGATVIWKLNLLAALCCAGSVFFFHRVLLSLLAVFAKTSSKSASLRIAAAVGALTLAFSRTFWSQSVGVEVYSLHLLLVSWVLFLFLRALPEGAFEAGTRADPFPKRRAWFLFAFALGLSFANHMTTLLLLPGLLYLYFAAHGTGLPAWKNAGRATPFFLPGLLPYLYLPLRAAAAPAMNWGAIIDWDTFRWHVSGRQYAGWMFSSLEPAGRQLSLFVRTLPSEFGYLALLPALAGLILLFRRSRRLFAFTLLLFLGCLLYSINYDIADIVNYFLLAYAVIALWAAFGVFAFLKYAAAGRRATAFAACGLAALVFLSPLALHYREVDESGNHGAEDYARGALEAAGPGAVILTTQWDIFIAAAYYLQLVEGVRPDVVIVDQELMRRTWYYRYLEARHPWLVEASRAEIDAFLPELRKFERGLPYDPATIQERFEAVIRGFVRESARTRPVYSTLELTSAPFPELTRVPSGTLLRLNPAETSPPSPPITFRPFPKDNDYFRMLRNYYGMALVNQGLARMRQGDEAGFEESLRRALAVNPGYREALELLRQLEAFRRDRPPAPP